MVCSLGTGSVGRGTRCAQLSVMSVLQVAAFERNVKSPAAGSLRSLDSSVSEAPWFTLQNQTGLLSVSVLLGYSQWPFLPNTFLFNDLNMHYDPRICPLQWPCGCAERWVDGYQALLSAVSSWEHVQGLAMIMIWGWAFPEFRFISSQVLILGFL